MDCKRAKILSHIYSMADFKREVHAELIGTRECIGVPPLN